MVLADPFMSVSCLVINVTNEPAEVPVPNLLSLIWKVMAVVTTYINDEEQKSGTVEQYHNEMIDTSGIGVCPLPSAVEQVSMTSYNRANSSPRANTSEGSVVQPLDVNGLRTFSADELKREEFFTVLATLIKRYSSQKLQNS